LQLEGVLPRARPRGGALQARGRHALLREDRRGLPQRPMTNPQALVLRNARLAPLDARADAGRAPVDVLVADGRIAQMGPGLQAPAGAPELDLDGRWLIPGLVDHHVHFALWARQRARLDVSGARSARDVAALVQAAAAD